MADRRGDGRSGRRAVAGQPVSNFLRVVTAAARIVLVNGAPRILPNVDERLARSAAAKLERMGVGIRTQTLVTRMDGEGLVLQTTAFAKAVLAVRRFETVRGIDTPDGGDLPCQRIAELTFDDPDALQAGIASDAWLAAVDDIRNFASGGVTLFIAEIGG